MPAPQRQPQPVEPKRHQGTIITERPNQMWGIEATAGFTRRDDQAAIFAMLDHCTRQCLGIHVAQRGTRFAALEHFDSLEEIAEALEEFRRGYIERWLVQKLHFSCPQQARHALLALEAAA